MRPSNGVPKFFPQVQGLAADVQTLGLEVVKCRVFWTGFIAILGEPVGGPHINKQFLSFSVSLDFVHVSTCPYVSYVWRLPLGLACNAYMFSAVERIPSPKLGHPELN